MQRFLVNDIAQVDFYRRLEKMIISLSFSLQSIDPQNTFFTIKQTYCVKDNYYFFFPQKIAQKLTIKKPKNFHIFISCIFLFQGQHFSDARVSLCFLIAHLHYCMTHSTDRGLSTHLTSAVRCIMVKAVSNNTPVSSLHTSYQEMN